MESKLTPMATAVMLLARENCSLAVKFVTDGGGAVCSVESEDCKCVAACSITGAGTAWKTTSAGFTYSITGPGSSRLRLRGTVCKYWALPRCCAASFDSAPVSVRFETHGIIVTDSMKIITERESSFILTTEREAVRDVKEKRCVSYPMFRHPSLLFEHLMIHLTERGCSLSFHFVRVCFGMSFQPHSTGTEASGIHDTSFTSARFDIRKFFLYANVVPSGGRPCSKGPVSVCWEN